MQYTKFESGATRYCVVLTEPTRKRVPRCPVLGRSIKILFNERDRSTAPSPTAQRQRMRSTPLDGKAPSGRLIAQCYMPEVPDALT